MILVVEDQHRRAAKIEAPVSPMVRGTVGSHDGYPFPTALRLYTPLSKIRVLGGRGKRYHTDSAWISGSLAAFAAHRRIASLPAR
jgi:hypothetical protein